MTDYIRTLPMASLGLLLDLFLLSIGIEAEAFICMKRFKYLGQWKAFSGNLSRKNLNSELNSEMLVLPSLILPYDGMPVRHVFNKPYQILALFKR